MISIRLSYVLAFSLFSASFGLQADVIFLKDGQRQAGVIILDRADLPTVTIRTSSGDIALRRDRIDHIEAEPMGIGYARLGDQFMDKKDFSRAVSAYKKAADTEKTNPDIASKLKQAEAAVEGQRQAQQEENLAQIDENLAKARQLAKEKNFDDAVGLLKQSNPGADSPKTADYRKTSSLIYQLWGADRADRQDLAGAADRLQQALRFDPKNSEARQLLIRVWESDPTKTKEVAEFYKDSTAPEDQLKLAEALFKQKNYEAALPIYLGFLDDPKLGTATIRDRVHLMFEMLHRNFAEKGDFARAIEYYQAFLQFSPEESQVPLVKYQYMLRRSQTDMNDMNARLALAQFAEQAGLVDTAKQEYLNIIQVAPNNQAAVGGLKRYAVADLQDATDFYTDGQYSLSMQKAESVASIYGIFPDIVQEAEQLQAKAQVELQKVAKTQKQQAVALAERGNDYYGQALAYVAAMASSNINTSVRVFSPKVEAIKYLQRALFAWQSALKMDSSLGDPVSYDLNRKIADAYARYVVLANPMPPRMPARDLSRTHGPGLQPTPPTAPVQH